MQKAGMDKPRSYFVSSSGNDENEGTRKSAFKSISRINKVHLNPGDSILFETGKHFNGSLILKSDSTGDFLHPIYIGSFGSGYSSLDGGNSSAIIIQKTNWVVLKKLKLIGSGRKKGNTHDGLLIQNSSHISVDSLQITGFQNQGCSSVRLKISQ